MRKNRFGLSVALATPFSEDGAIDLPRPAAHGRQSFTDGCASLTVFGTTGEGASLGLDGRQRASSASPGQADVRKLGVAIDATLGKRAA